MNARSRTFRLLFLHLLLVAAPGLWACGTHGTNAGNDWVEAKYGGDADGDGRLLFTIGIEDLIVEPTEPTTCVTAIGLGSTERSLPQGAVAVSARVDRVNRTTGKATPVEYFRFSADGETTNGMAAGGGSAAGDPRPLFAGATWFGFSSPVDPFTLETGPDEYIRMTFEVLVPEALAPLLTDVQFASGEGQADGTPIFTGEHPVQYYTGSNPVLELRRFMINAGLNDAWIDPSTAGQGFLISVFPDTGILFLAWFTYDVERPPEDVTAMLGEPGHRWLTAQGAFAEDRAVLDVWLTRGGVFDSADPPVSRERDGTMVVEFTGCNSGTISYDIPSVDRQRAVPIERIVLDNVPLCEELDAMAAATAQ